MPSAGQNAPLDGRPHAEIDIHQSMIDSTDSDYEIRDDRTKTCLDGHIGCTTRLVFMATG
jgi:hypothetical protein